MATPCPVVHFEMPYEDPARMTAFYAKVFGWTHQQLGAEMGDYILAATGPSDNGRATEPGTINGGFFPRSEENPAKHPSVVIAVGDIAASIAEVKAAGGTVLNEPMAIPGVGTWASFLDTEGNLASMLQPLMSE